MRRAILLAFALLTIGPAVQQAHAQNACSGFGIPPVTLTPTLPIPFVSGMQQQGADCLAWQQFIYLNWQADPNKPGYPNPNAAPSSFGTAGDTTPTVWESYADPAVVFNPQSNALRLFAAARTPIKTLVRTGKLGPTSITLGGPNGFEEASGGWLTNQRGTLTYYEIRINEDEYDFITKNQFNGSDLTTYAGQLACASQAGTNGVGGFNLPSGYTNPDTDCTGARQTYGQNIGAIEIKAAWTILPSDGSLNYRYKIANAQITDPYGNVSQATVGLVGLHIIHKFPGAQQFVWATFEQIDNSPDDNNGGTATWPKLPPNPNQKPSPGYTFFNPNCTATTDTTYHCQRNLQPTKPCPPTPTPGCQPYTAPMQVTRITPFDSYAYGATASGWSVLPAASVFNYYRLIDVQWPNSSQRITPGQTAPLPTGDITPASSNRIVANTVLETFVQKSRSCMDCHQYAPIAQKSVSGRIRRILVFLPPAVPLPTGASTSYASDYSFVFSTETDR